MLEPEEKKAKEDIQSIQDHELIGKIAVRSKKINDAADARGLELWRMNHHHNNSTTQGTVFQQ